MRWSKQCLHVWARTVRDARALERQYATLPESLRENTLLLITPCSGMEWIWRGSLVVKRSVGSAARPLPPGGGREGEASDGCDEDAEEGEASDGGDVEASDGG